MIRILSANLLFVVASVTLLSSAYALNGDTLQLNPRNNWRAFEIITVGDNPVDDGFDWTMPSTFDGLGARLSDASTLRILINHEISYTTISEVNINLSSFRTAISNTINSGSTDGASFVTSAREAFERWSSNGGASWINASDKNNTRFERFCSGQSYLPHTFGPGRGFVDNIYITGEETFGDFSFNRLFALDMNNRDFYQLSGVTGIASGGIGGLPRDSWENAALLDTGETDHVALLLSPDGGTSRMQLYIGEKGKDIDGNSSNDFLARNGLAYGSTYYLKGVLPSIGTPSSGTFDTTSTGALTASKFEDIDTSPSDPTRVVLGNQDFGLFTFNFDLDFFGGSFSSGSSSFSLSKIQNDISNTLGTFGDPDNVDWTAPTVLNGRKYAEGLIFVNEDNSNGEIWMNAPDGSDLTRIGDTAGNSSATETSGILDISTLLGYNPGSILLTSNQGTKSSLSVLINPYAEMDDADFDGDGDVDGADFLTWQRSFGAGTLPSVGDAQHNGNVDGQDLAVWQAQFGNTSFSSLTAVPEPSSLVFLLVLACAAAMTPRFIRSGTVSLIES
ncbi:hypothetical protein [Bythopirellula polymerisocia]|uniref:PEP-CTERM protein-sorting domain-containing protein n=1 Tax=Bythopirellula polymerisocia TaxID=2528003 RepID=A0A5C6CZ17_9BACT|nr:hypothetical protein [Bythopirellula polymerisocia]TWU28246.1 hypothetical protein Pla144_15330 [Bythopirellula polymerisocia]